jgi:hypothetical protein
MNDDSTAQKRLLNAAPDLLAICRELMTRSPENFSIIAMARMEDLQRRATLAVMKADGF